MSGGRYNYVCFKIEEFHDMLETQNNPRRIAFKKLLKLVADAAHEIEWEDSSDSSNANEAIDKVFQFFDKKNVALVAKANAYDGLISVLKNYIETEKID